MYEWLKVVHILAVVSWMAGLLYLPRLMVYHADALAGSSEDQTFRVMERRLLKAIMRPAGVVTLLTGLYLLHVAQFSIGNVWVVIKLLSVLGLCVVHGVLERHVKLFGSGKNLKSGVYFRVLNEVPTALLVVVVIMVVVKPFGVMTGGL